MRVFFRTPSRVQISRLSVACSVVRRDLVLRTRRVRRRRFPQMPAQRLQILLQTLYLLLLAKHRAVKRIEEVFREADLGLKFV